MKKLAGRAPGDLGVRAGREPWRIHSFDPVTHDLWVGDVGQGLLYEEVGMRGTFTSSTP